MRRAIYHCDVDAIRRCLEQNIQPDAPLYSTVTPMDLLASFSGDADPLATAQCFHVLLEAKASINTYDDGHSALSYAIHNRNSTMTRLLLDHKATIYPKILQSAIASLTDNSKEVALLFEDAISHNIDVFPGEIVEEFDGMMYGMNMLDICQRARKFLTDKVVFRSLRPASLTYSQFDSCDLKTQRRKKVCQKVENMFGVGAGKQMDKLFPNRETLNYSKRFF